MFGNVTICNEHGGPRHGYSFGRKPGIPRKAAKCADEGYDDDMIEWATSHLMRTHRGPREAGYFVSRGSKYDEELYKKHKAVTDAEHDKVVEVGGLYIIGTERHESRRIDNQLRGTSRTTGRPRCQHDSMLQWMTS